MEVTRYNFSELLPFVKDAIDDCNFMAIDTELTGLSTQVTEHSFDSVSERYLKLRENCMKFIITQFGLSAFKYHPKEKKYTHTDFNFYVFPRQHIRQAPDPKFMCQTSSLHFLASHGFDFNKVIYEGIQYLSPTDEEKVKAFLTNKHKVEKDALDGSSSNLKANGRKEVEVPEEEKQFIANIHKRVEAFLSDDTETTLNLDPCKPHQRKLIYDTVQNKHQKGIEMSSFLNDKKERIISIVKTTEEEKHKKLNIKQANDLDDLEIAVGFRKVLDLISQSKKLVVGHNMLLDLMHTIDKFFFSLPENLDEFKDIVIATFPKIMDTKVLATSEKLRPFFDSKGLGDLVNQLQGKAFELPVIEATGGFRSYELNSEKAHEAGYDAFMTGFSYIGMTHKLASLNHLPNKYADIPSQLLNPFLNRVFIMRHYDINALNLSAPDPEPDRNNVFYVSFPQEWKTIDLVELFLPYGNIYVNWLDDVSALVALKNKENVINAKTNLLNKTSRLYTVRAYSDYRKAMGMPSSGKKETDFQKTLAIPTNSDSSSTHKRRASGSVESMELIPEADESEAVKVDDPVSTSFASRDPRSPAMRSASSSGPSSKKQKLFHEENDSEVSSTAKVFDEENNW